MSTTLSQLRSALGFQLQLPGLEQYASVNIMRYEYLDATFSINGESGIAGGSSLGGSGGMNTGGLWGAMSRTY